MAKLKWERERRKVLGDRWWGEGKIGSYRILHVPRTAIGYTKSANGLWSASSGPAPTHYRLSTWQDPRGWTPIDSRRTLSQAKQSAEDHYGRNISN